MGRKKKKKKKNRRQSKVRKSMDGNSMIILVQT